MSEHVVFTPGATVAVGERPYRIHHILDLETVLAQDLQSGEAVRLKVADLQPVIPQAEIPPLTDVVELAQVPDSVWAIARQRFAAIRPLLALSQCTRAQVAECARLVGVHTATIYRWLKRYQHSGQLAALIPWQHNGGRGHSRLSPAVEAIVQATIEEVYLCEQKPSVQHACTEVLRRCRNAGLVRPHPNTIRYRIGQLSHQVQRRRREGAKAVAAMYTPLQGTFPGADWPLAVVQIDHTPVDLILVDDLHRCPVGRPWITVAIDVFSRMVAGFYVSFDPPGATAVGLCLAHAILPKETWLAKYNITTSWPVWGMMNVVHADNAQEFHGRMLRKACENYGIDLHWRPVAQPHYGGHIERLLGTLNHDIHALPGTTFSNPVARGSYDSDKQSALTLAEFERWLTIYIAEVYHQRLHSELGTTPMKRYEEGMFGTAESPGRGLPDRVIDEARLRLDLMPYVERTVQRYGIVIDEIQYYDDVLRPWINANDPRDASSKRKFIVRRDPRDLSVVYFFDPDIRQYFSIPYRQTAHPPISVWELREVKRQLKADGRKAVNEDLIFNAYNRLRALEDDALRATKKARRSAQRRRGYAQIERPSLVRHTSSDDFPVDDLEEIRPFEEIEELNDCRECPSS
jgi:putative transposase